MTHAELMAAVVERCDALGLRHAHFPDSRRAPSGWPDLVIWGPRGLLFVEIKSEDGRVTLGQLETIRSLLSAGQRAYVWRPSDPNYGYIPAILRSLAGEPGGSQP